MERPCDGVRLSTVGGGNRAREVFVEVTVGVGAEGRVGADGEASLACLHLLCFPVVKYFI